MFQPTDSSFSSQIMVYKDIGEEMLQHAFEGNARVLFNKLCKGVNLFSINFIVFLIEIFNKQSKV